MVHFSQPKYFSSDDFIQAQQQLARWASEDVVSVVVRDGSKQQTVMMDPATGNTIGPVAAITHHGDNNIATPLNINTMNHKNRDYYPSPTSTETESSENAMQQIQTRRDLLDFPNGGIETTESYPEYKH